MWDRWGESRIVVRWIIQGRVCWCVLVSRGKMWSKYRTGIVRLKQVSGGPGQVWLVTYSIVCHHQV